MERINHGVLAVWPEGNAQVDGAAPCQPGGNPGIPISEKRRPKRVLLRFSCHCTVDDGHGTQREAWTSKRRWHGKRENLLSTAARPAPAHEREKKQGMCIRWSLIGPCQ